MKKSTKQALLDAWDWCDDEDKSTEFMLAYMSDMSGLSYDSVVSYISQNRANLDRAEYYKRKGKLEIAKRFEDHYNNHLYP